MNIKNEIYRLKNHKIKFKKIKDKKYNFLGFFISLATRFHKSHKDICDHTHVDNPL